jgi:hypothetical protein
MKLKFMQKLSSSQIPYLYNIVKSSGDYPTTIGSKPDSADATRMTLVRLYASLLPDVPNL